jgi:hypothetical protein
MFARNVVDCGCTGYAVTSSTRVFHGLSAGKTAQPPNVGTGPPLLDPEPELEPDPELEPELLPLLDEPLLLPELDDPLPLPDPLPPLLLPLPLLPLLLLLLLLLLDDEPLLEAPLEPELLLPFPPPLLPPLLPLPLPPPLLLVPPGEGSVPDPSPAAHATSRPAPKHSEVMTRARMSRSSGSPHCERRASPRTGGRPGKAESFQPLTLAPP